ncbi:hypothetical protein G7Y89_g11636 [Cudoniella acicularis]|uniref:Uncharacterized protein n=1 Tax=Cudoniella acicularis TaxID=354080 RepID=A0A8H4VZY7_9HELO|nr:hypothetical protein G7Y89_g11636 [Cudoniella acicularis]
MQLSVYALLQVPSGEGLKSMWNLDKRLGSGIGLPDAYREPQPSLQEIDRDKVQLKGVLSSDSLENRNGKLDICPYILHSSEPSSSPLLHQGISFNTPPHPRFSSTKNKIKWHPPSATPQTPRSLTRRKRRLFRRRLNTMGKPRSLPHYLLRADLHLEFLPQLLVRESGKAKEKN